MKGNGVRAADYIRYILHNEADDRREPVIVASKTARTVT